MTVPNAGASAASQAQYALSPDLVSLSEPLGQGAEYIRALRTHVLSQHIELGRRALVICEPAPKMGATFVACNLAVSLAQTGVKTLLIDGNLRAPAVQYYIRPEREAPGLRECLSGAAPSAAAFVHDGVLPHLSILYAGGPAANAQELLAQPAFESIVTACMRDYAVTIIDTPPANSCADSLRIATVAGYSLIVTRRHKGLVSDVKTLAAQLRGSRATVVGAVMNDG